MSTKKHTIYVINTSESGKSYWNRAGVAFANRDGSFTLKLDILPQTKFQLREEQPVAKAGGGRRVAAARGNQGALPWLSFGRTEIEAQMLRGFRTTGEKGNRFQAPSGRSWRNLCANEESKELRIARHSPPTPRYP